MTDKIQQAFTDWYGGLDDPSPTYQQTFESGYRAALASAEPEERTDGMPASKVERQLRRMLCAQRHGVGAYMDDGEASWGGDATHRIIDYMRETPEAIEQAWRDAGVKQLASAEPAGELPLERWGRSENQSLRLLDRMDDGYWTPWHIATEAIRSLQAEIGRLASLKRKAEEDTDDARAYGREADAEVEQLRAELAQSKRVQTEWQPIETAPMDGTVFLGYRDGRFREAYRVQRDDCEMWCFGGSSGAVDIAPWLKPTHWMPLPAAPQAAQPTPAQPVNQVLLDALKTIKHSMEQAKIYGNDVRREIHLSHSVAVEAIAQAQAAHGIKP